MSATCDGRAGAEGAAERGAGGVAAPEWALGAWSRGWGQGGGCRLEAGRVATQACSRQGRRRLQ
eukprot:scaffold921_cov101-Isochrysis_galbana.AAC.8